MTIEKAIEIVLNRGVGYTVEDGEIAFKMAIKALEQEQKTGHWITGRSTYYDVEMYRCSECKSWFAYKAEECPNCHVRMESEG